MPTIKDPTWAAEPPAGALEAGALSPDGLGLLIVVAEEGNERGRPANGAGWSDACAGL